ncbi:MAG: SUMF1/EgtB/PvdO family nonheme iron enzyme, partial [Muribaculaceae bacterium]|nr:SUMF1/EgtB/PvdO family nonheme iron enzyme [Muribaculaceae bacterium]
HPVGQKLDNELGIFDMSGNVWEWCSANYSSSYSQPRNSSYRVFRGGSWTDSASRCRVANRSYNSPGSRFNALGLRLAL